VDMLKRVAGEWSSHDDMSAGNPGRDLGTLNSNADIVPQEDQGTVTTRGHALRLSSFLPIFYHDWPCLIRGSVYEAIVSLSL
jgi:hypothetical protein